MTDPNESLVKMVGMAFKAGWYTNKDNAHPDEHEEMAEADFQLFLKDPMGYLEDMSGVDSAPAPSYSGLSLVVSNDH